MSDAPLGPPAPPPASTDAAATPPPTRAPAVQDERLPILLNSLVQFWRERHPERPALIGVGGAQGSGKSTLCRAFAADNPRVAHFSLDDVYRTRAEREAYARQYCAHVEDQLRDTRFLRGGRNRAVADLFPLLLTRGPPGTHDLSMARGLIARLRTPAETPLPRFDKARDDRVPQSEWPVFHGPAEATLIDGWCMGATEAPDSAPLNAVEREDWTGKWREHMAQELALDYAPFFAAFDAIVYLQAPSWEIVRRWRGQQEEEALGRPLTDEEALALDRFVMHYERITRAMLEGQTRAGWIVYLDEDRNVTRIEERR